MRLASMCCRMSKGGCFRPGNQQSNSRGQQSWLSCANTGSFQDGQQSGWRKLCTTQQSHVHQCLLQVVLFCDMHGHSRKYGVFIYGCEKKPGKDDRPQFSGWPVPGSVGGLPGVPLKCQPNMFPLMLYLNAPDLFSYRSCNFKVFLLW